MVHQPRLNRLTMVDGSLHLPQKTRRYPGHDLPRTSPVSSSPLLISTNPSSFSNLKLFVFSNPTLYGHLTPFRLISRISGLTDNDFPCLRFFRFSFYAPQLVPAGTAEARISYGISVCPSVRLSVCLSVTTRWYTKHR